MQRLHLSKALVICFTLLVAFTAWAGAEPKELVGTWNMVSVTPDGDQVKWTLSIKEGAEGKLVGSLKSDEGEMEAKDFSVTDGVVKLKTPYGGDFYDIEVRLASGKLTGKWMGNGAEGETTGTKGS